MNHAASITALMPVFVRAYHVENARKPIFADTKARELMTDGEYRMIAAYILGQMDFFAPDQKDRFAGKEEALTYLVNTQLAGASLARAAFCEDALKTAMRTGTAQYVILGTGMDTFAFREPEFLRKYNVFEVDHTLMQSEKKDRIQRAGWTVPEKLHFVPVDFAKDNLRTKLLEAGFRPQKKTFFSWLGSSMYLYRDEMEAMLQKISALAADGSSLVFDYADEGLLLSDVKRVQNMLAMAKVGGKEAKSSFDQLSMELMLSDYDFLVYEHLNCKEIQKRYFSKRSDGLSAFEHISYAHAVWKK